MVPEAKIVHELAFNFLSYLEHFVHLLLCTCIQYYDAETSVIGCSRVKRGNRESIEATYHQRIGIKLNTIEMNVASGQVMSILIGELYSVVTLFDVFSLATWRCWFAQLG